MVLRGSWAFSDAALVVLWQCLVWAGVLQTWSMSTLSTHKKSSSFMSEPNEKLNEGEDRGNRGEGLVEAGETIRDLRSYLEWVD